MTKQEYFSLINNSFPDDWEYHDSKQLYVFNKDLDIRIQLEDNKEDGFDEFREPWVNVFPNQVGERLIYSYYYASTFVGDEVFVGVDGLRAVLPLPRNAELLTVVRRLYNLGSIINIPYGRYEEYFRTARFQIVEL